MLTELCAALHNYFTDDANKHFGDFTISGGKLEPLDFLADGQYFRVIGSTFNDGVYQYPHTFDKDEAFGGAVWAMTVPPSVIALADEIKAFQDSEESKPSAYTSESFGGYSYSKATNKNGAPMVWQDVFEKRMRQWRKV